MIAPPKTLAPQAILISSWGRTELGPRNSTTTMGEHNWYNRRTLPLMRAPLTVAPAQCAREAGQRRRGSL